MTSYRVVNDGVEETIDIQPSLITISTSIRGTSQGGGATTMSHASFLDGSFDDHVRRLFGDAVLAEVRAQCVDATDDAFGGATGATRTMLQAWSTVPIDQSLETMTATADDLGSIAFHYPPPEGSILETAGATLALDRSGGPLTRPDGTTSELDWRCPHTAALACRGQFFVTACDHGIVFDTDGDVVLSTDHLAEPFGVGTSVRINELIRVEDTVVFGYQTIAGQADPVHQHLGSAGALRLDPQGRIIARASFEPSVIGRRRAALRDAAAN